MNNDTQAAFPSIYDQTHEQNWGYDPGMTLLDYFAAKAMQGILANGYVRDCMTGNQAAAGYAEDAYCIARAMLAHRAAHPAPAAPPVAKEAGV